MDCVDELCKFLKNNDLPFGGIPFVGIGDFRQVAPVVKGAGSGPSRLASVKSSNVWHRFSVLRLHIPIRSARDPVYTQFVDNIGENYLQRRVRIDLLDTVQNLDECVNFLFPPTVLENPLRALKRAFLSPKNYNVDDFNTKVLDCVNDVERASHTLSDVCKPLQPFFFDFQTCFTVLTLSKRTLNPQNMI